MAMLALTRDLIRIRPYHKRLSGLPQTLNWERIAYGSHTKQYGLWAPQPNGPAPLAVWIHGGGWRFGSPELLCAFGEYFHARGYHVWLPSHRRLPRFRGETIIKDVAESLTVPAALIEAHTSSLARASALPSPTPTVIGGMSSGGQLATLLALRPELVQPLALKTSGLIACGAPLSLKHLGASPVRRRLAGAKGGAVWQDLDPLAQLAVAPDFPAIVLHGTHDGLVPFASGVAFASEARRRGWDALRFVALPGGDHLSAASWLFSGERKGARP